MSKEQIKQLAEFLCHKDGLPFDDLPLRGNPGEKDKEYFINFAKQLVTIFTKKYGYTRQPVNESLMAVYEKAKEIDIFLEGDEENSIQGAANTLNGIDDLLGDLQKAVKKVS